MPNVDAGASFVGRYGPWAVITGGSEGVGAAWGRALVDRGVGVVLVARRPEPLEATASALRERGGDVRTISLDVTDPDVVERLRSVTDDIEVGTLILNAGAMRTRQYTWFLDEDLRDIETVITLNTLVTARLVHGYGRAMRDRGFRRHRRRRLPVGDGWAALRSGLFGCEVLRAGVRGGHVV